MNETRRLIGRSPFSHTGLAALEWETHTPVTVVTSAIEAGNHRLASYLRSTSTELAAGPLSAGPEGPDPQPATGGVLAGDAMVVVGDYGMGKTHLATHLLREAKRWERTQSRIKLHCGYLAATAGGFEQLYRDFVTGITEEELTSVVDDYYADVVADALSESDYTRNIAIEVRAGRREASEVAKSLDLIDSILARQLRTRLEGITRTAALGQTTRTEEFGTALSLMLLRKVYFAEDVWGWLHGEKPSNSLISRGVTHVIEGEEMSIGALCALLYLFGQSQHRLVVAIDELDRMVFSSKANQSPLPDWVQTVIQIFAEAGAFLVATALPDVFEATGKSSLQRPLVWQEVEPFTPEQIQRLIERSQPQGRLEPFAPETPAVIAKVTGGVPRQVIRLCDRAWKTSASQRGDAITADVILDAATVRMDLPTPTVVRRAIRSVLWKLGAAFREDYSQAPFTDPVDFWVHGETVTRGCAIFLADFVVTEEAADNLVTRALAFQAEGRAGGGGPGQAERTAILVVVGHVHEDFRARLGQVFETDPLGFEARDFPDALAAVVSRVLARSESRGETSEETLARVRSDLGRLTVQQATSQNYLDRLAMRVDEVRAAMGRLPTAVARDLREAGAGRAGEPQPQTPGTELPEHIEEAFRPVEQTLADLIGPRADMRRALESVISQGEPASESQDLGVHLGRSTLYEEIGYLAVQRDLVGALRESVASLWASLRPGIPAEEARVKNAVRRTCDVFEHLVSSMPSLDANGDLVLLGDPDQSDQAVYLWLDRWQAGQRQLMDLGRAVLEMAYSLVEEVCAEQNRSGND